MKDWGTLQLLRSNLESIIGSVWTDESVARLDRWIHDACLEQVSAVPFGPTASFLFPPTQRALLLRLTLQMIGPYHLCL